MLRIVINNENIEYFNASDIGLSLSKRAIDPAKPFARLGSRSYTVTFPATNVNNRIFGNGNHTQTVNKFGTYSCKVYEGSILLISGVFKLTAIQRDIYEGYIVSDNVGFKDLITNKSIQDLNLGSFRFVGHKRDDEINGITLQNTWQTDFEYWDKMWFPLISYGNFYKSGAFDRYAKIDKLSFEDFTPNFSYTGVLRAIFEEAGYTVSGELVDNEELNDLMFTFQGSKVPWNWELLTKIILISNDSRNTDEVDVGIFGTSTNPLIANKRRYYLRNVNEFKDHLSRYDNANVVQNPVGQEWFCPREGTNEFTLTVNTTQTLNADIADTANALEQAKHNKICLVNVDDANTTDENSSLFTGTTTPYAGIRAASGTVDYERTTDLTLLTGETQVLKFDSAVGGILDPDYNPATGEYTAFTDQVVNINSYIKNAPQGIRIDAYVNGNRLNIQSQGANYAPTINAQGQITELRLQEVNPFTYYYPTNIVADVPAFAIPYIGFGGDTGRTTEFQLQKDDILTLEITNGTNADVTIPFADISFFALEVESLDLIANRPVPIFELDDSVKAYLEPWKNSLETAEEKVGGSPSHDFELISIDFSNNAYTDNGGGNYTYNTDIEYKFRVSCEKGELMKFMLLTYNDNAVNNNYNIDSYTIYKWQIVDGSGEEFDIANALPNISQIDYVTDALQLFNLYYNIDESNKTISFLKRSRYFRTDSPIEMPFSLHDRNFTQSKAPRNLFLGLKQTDDSYADQLEGLRQIDANPFADKDSTFTFASKLFGQAYKRLYTIEGDPRDSAQFEIPTLSPNNSANILRANVGELQTNTAPRLIFRGNGNFVYRQFLQGIGVSSGVIQVDGEQFSQLPISRVDPFVSFLDGDTIFGEYWDDDFLYQATDVLTIKVAMTAGQYNKLDLRRSVVLENNTYTIQEVSGFNPLNPSNVTIKLLRL